MHPDCMYACMRACLSVVLAADVKAVWSLMPVLLALPLFWALFDQQGSSWILQAKKMNRQLGAVSKPPKWDAT